MTNLGSILKSKGITWPAEVPLVKPMVFPVVMYGCESWTIKKGKCQIIDVFEWWCWKRLLRVPWTAKTSNQSIQKKINPKYSLEELMLKLKLQYLADSLEKSLMPGKIEGRRRGWQSRRWLDGITDSMTWVWVSSRRWRRIEKPGMLSNWTELMGSQRVRHDWATEQHPKYCKGFSLCFFKVALFHLQILRAKALRSWSPDRQVWGGESRDILIAAVRESREH